MSITALYSQSHLPPPFQTLKKLRKFIEQDKRRQINNAKAATPPPPAHRVSAPAPAPIPKPAPVCAPGPAAPAATPVPVEPMRIPKPDMSALYMLPAR